MTKRSFEWLDSVVTGPPHWRSPLPPKSFRIDIPQAKLDDLNQRLDTVNWPHDFGNDDWSYGVPLAYLKDLTDYWRNGFDWRAQEAAMNEHTHFKSEVDGLPIHYIHERGRGPNPIPIILSHGWPWTFWDLNQVIPALVDPAAHGGDPADSFDVVVPSLPGFIFSTPLTRTGIGPLVTADLWHSLMHDELGYDRFAAQGGDWGAMITTQLAYKYSESLIGIHLTNAFPVPAFSNDRPWSIANVLSPEEEDPANLAEMIDFQKRFAAHIAVHMLHPQTLGYAFHDSPVGLLAWMLEKRFSWGDCRGDVESRFSRDHLLTTMSLYWLTDSFVTSARYYSEASREEWTPMRESMPQVPVPTALSMFKHDMAPGPTDWTQDYYDLRQIKIRDDGGHFAPAENPSAVIQDIRDHFRALR